MIILPTHERCGSVGAGPLDDKLVAVCTEIRTFARCPCPRSKKEPTRGTCDACGKTGWVVMSTSPGCGARFGLNAHGQRVLLANAEAAPGRAA